MSTETVDYKITSDGPIVISDIYIMDQSPTMKYVVIEGKSKYFKVSYTGSHNEFPVIGLRADEDTLNIREGSNPLQDDTEIQFNLPDWSIALAAVNGRYSVGILFCKYGT